MPARRFDPLVMFDIPRHAGRNIGGGQLIAINGVDFFVDTVNGSDSRSGLSWDSALATVAEAFTRLGTPKGYTLPGQRKGSNSRIFIIGNVAEQITAPLGVFGTKIIGAFGGRPRHTTDNGSVVDGNGAAWVQAAVAGAAPLLTLRQQGWEVWGMMMVPESGYAAIRWRREETTTYPDASHAIVSGNRFFQSGSVGLGIDDYGSQSHCSVLDNEFDGLEYGFKSGNVGISAANRHIIARNHFFGCKNDIYTNSYGSRIEENRFGSLYDGTTHPNTINLVATADAGLAANPNFVQNNWFAEVSANVVIAKGFKPATGDVWRNWSSNAADPIVAVPT